MSLTDRQQQVFDIIVAYRQEHGRSPTAREVGEPLGLSPIAANKHIQALLKKGSLRKSGFKRTPRSIEPVDMPVGVASVHMAIDEIVEDRDLADRLKKRVSDLPRLISEVFNP